MARKKRFTRLIDRTRGDYTGLLDRVSGLLDQARSTTVRVTNAILTATYWQVGRQIVEFEQGGRERADYGEEFLVKLAGDLTRRFGRGYSRTNLQSMRLFFLGWQICQTPSGKFMARAKCQTLSGEFGAHLLSASEVGAANDDAVHEGAEFAPVALEQMILPLNARAPELFPLPWSHYVQLLSVKDEFARWFYEDEAIIAGWSVRQLDRMISTQHYERTMLSKNKAAMLHKGRAALPEDVVHVEELIKDPYVLEFLNLKNEYSETELEEAIIKDLEAFLLEMGVGFTFVARQFSFRVDGESFRMDLVLFHRLLRCLVIIDLKLGKFTHADAGQMNLYLNYAKENMLLGDESPPIGLILCSHKSDAVVRYAMGGINARVFAAQYLTKLPSADLLKQELLRTKHAFETRSIAAKRKS